MRQFITCTSEGVYNLTRGQQYELLAHDSEKQQVRVRGNLGRCSWFPSGHFDLNGGTVPVLVKWYFDDAVVDELNGRDETQNWVDVVCELDKGTRRWCQMTTPQFLARLLKDRTQEPMVYCKNLIIVRDLTTATVEQVLRYMDRQGELNEFSLPVGTDTLDLPEETIGPD